MGENRSERLERLGVFVGEWRLEAPAFPLPAELADAARTNFAWTRGGAFLLQQATIPAPEAPDGHMLIGLDGADGYTQHYFDSRGIARIYAMTFDGREWMLERRSPDFTPLDFHQRWLGAFSLDGNTIEGAWESSSDGESWSLDFELNYRRVQ